MEKGMRFYNEGEERYTINGSRCTYCGDNMRVERCVMDTHKGEEMGNGHLFVIVLIGLWLWLWCGGCVVVF